MGTVRSAVKVWVTGLGGEGAREWRQLVLDTLLCRVRRMVAEWEEVRVWVPPP